ncbi:type II secretion system protein [Sulfurimonas sp. HSL3-2]
MVSNKKAFTMLELVFVIVVLGILAAIAIPKFAATRDDAIEAKVKKQINAIRTSIESLRQARIQALGGMENSRQGTLTLYYDYQPWKGETYQNGKSQIIMEDVDTFRFRSVGDLIKVQLCVTDSNISTSGGYSICKEKTVF